MRSRRPALCVGCALCAIVSCACDGNGRQISHSGVGAYEVSLATAPGRMAAAWYDTRDGNAEIYLSVLEPHTGRRAAEHRVTHTADDSYEADIQLLEQKVAVAWYEKAFSGELGARLGVWDDSMELEWQRSVAAGGGATRNPVLQAYGDRLFCAWIERAESGEELVWAAWWGADGTRLGEPIRLGAASTTTWNLNAAVDANGDAYVVYDAKADTRAEEIFLARVKDRSASLTRLTTDDGERSKYPDLVFGDETAALTWFDERDGNSEVYFYAAQVADFAAGIDRLAYRVTHTPGESIGAYVAANRGGFALAWSDADDGLYDVYFLSFDAQGVPQSSIQRLTQGRARSLIPAIRPWEDGFAIAWNEVAAAGAAGLHHAGTRSEIMLSVVR